MGISFWGELVGSWVSPTAWNMQVMAWNFLDFSEFDSDGIHGENMFSY